MDFRTSYEKLTAIQKNCSSILSIGLDPDILKLPSAYSKNVGDILDFNCAIIEATKDIVCAYKMNFAFYEQYGTEGFKVLKKTFEYIPDDIFTIADAKRGDIGNTSEAYSKACFDYFGADSVTVNPYMGKDSVLPFLKYNQKMTFLLALTSNPGSAYFQKMNAHGKPLFRHVVEKSLNWASRKTLGYVIGATHPGDIKTVRQIALTNFLLIPGIGTQGGEIAGTLKANNNKPAIVNVSRSIIYASTESNFAQKARDKAKFYNETIRKLSNNKI